MGPGGTRPSSGAVSASAHRVGAIGAMVMMGAFRSRSLDGTAEHAERHRDVAPEDDDGDDCRRSAYDRIPPSVVDSPGLEHAPGAVIQVQAKGEHGGYVDQHHPPFVEAPHDVAVDVSPDVGEAGVE